MGQSTSRLSVRQGEEETTACKEEPETQPSCRATVLILTTPGRWDTDYIKSMLATMDCFVSPPSKLTNATRREMKRWCGWDEGE